MTSSKTPGSSNHNLIGYRIDQGRLEFMSVLGLGAYGVVYLARDLTSPDMRCPKLYAVKALNKVGLDARQKSFQRREIALHSLASSHPSIVTLHAVIESPSCVFVVLDYCPDGDLFGMITEKQKYLGKTEAVKSVFIQIVDAVQFCHSLGIGHRDLKPENILCKNNGAEVVLADFGLATAEKTSSDFGCGSTFYMSPECQGGLFERLGSYSTLHNDIWSLGIILVNLTCGRNPWKQACPSDESFRAYLANPDFLRSILPISEPCNSLLKRILAINPFGRISLQELKEEVLRIETFNMTADELGKATKATREAAHAWLKDHTPNPQSQESTIDFSTRQDALSRKTKQPNARPPKIDQVCAAHRSTVFHHQVGKQQPPNEDGFNYLVQHVVSPSVYSFNHRQRIDRPALYQSGFGSPLAASPQFTNPPHDSVPYNINMTSSNDVMPHEPMVSALKPPPISKVSSIASNERSKRPQVLPSRLRKNSNVASTFSPSSKHEPPIALSCKKLFPKPPSFTRLNAPCPIILKPLGESPQAAACSNPGALMTPRSKKKIPVLPYTPPSSVSPEKTTFGFIKKPSRFFPSSGHSNHELPPTPSSPNHPIKAVAAPSSTSCSAIAPPPSRRCRKIFSRSPLSINHRENKTPSSFTSHSFDEDLDIVRDDTPVNGNFEKNKEWLSQSTRPYGREIDSDKIFKWKSSKVCAFKSFI